MAEFIESLVRFIGEIYCTEDARFTSTPKRNYFVAILNRASVTETIQIKDLPIEKMRALIEKARAAGTTPEEYARRLIEQGLAPRELTFDEILAPFRRQVTESDIARGK